MEQSANRGHSDETLRKNYSLPEGVIPKVQCLEPLTTEELEATRQNVYGDNYFSVKPGGSKIYSSVGQEQGVRKRGTTE